MQLQMVHSLLQVAVILWHYRYLFGIADEISYISTGGGAFLEFVREGKVLPAVESTLESVRTVN